MFTKRTGMAVFGVATSLVLTGCPDDGNFLESEGVGAGAGLRDLHGVLEGLGGTIDGRRLEVSLVNNEDNVSSARAVVEAIPLPGAGGEAIRFTMPNALPKGDYRADIWADDGDGTYQAPMGAGGSVSNDESWRVAVAAGDDAVVQLSVADFVRARTDIGVPAATNAGSDLTVVFSGYDAAVGQLMELRVTEKGSGATVGLYRNYAITGADFSINLPGVMRQNVEYRIAWFVDGNASGKYEAPPSANGDQAWYFDVTGRRDGLNLSHDYTTNWKDVGFDQDPVHTGGTGGGEDAGTDSGLDTGLDAPIDAGLDTNLGLDAGGDDGSVVLDAGLDTSLVDADLPDTTIEL